jgi:D-3-phosphoglycerate dehydrogenase / 2-oxoglutarate reductase
LTSADGIVEAPRGNVRDSEMARILVTENIADGGLQQLRDAGHVVDVRLGLSPDELVEVIPGAAALIIRSATQVTREVLESGTDLVVVGRAGIGLDNVDVEAATQRGVMVVNAPQSNILSAAEHTMALLLAQARNIPQAHQALSEGRWERSKWEGVELADKTLGIVGLGRIGKLVAQRALAFGMRLVAYDPFVSAERARQVSVELMPLERLVQVADFVTLHVAKTPDTAGLIGKDLLAQAKPGIRIVNVARGGIVDEAALAEAIRAGRVAGAALDVFAAEPTTESPLFGLPQVVVTPHLGASTREAQDKAGDTIAEQVALALDDEFVPFAVNVSAAEASETVRPFLPLAERLGELYGGLAERVPDVLEVEYAGQLADYDTRILTLSVLKGVFGRVTDEPVSYVNAPRIASERGVEVRDTSTATAHDYVNLVTIRGGDHAIAGTLVGLRAEPRIVMLDGHTTDLPPAKNMLVVRNDDRPGMIAFVAGVLADSGVNIDDMHLGRSDRGEAAVQVIATDVAVPPEVKDAIRAGDGVVSVHGLN